MKKLVKLVLRAVRRENKNNLFWVGREKDCPNFGDLIGPYLFNKITDRDPVYTKPSNISCSTVFLTVGSILSWSKENSIIWGSGIIYKDQTFPKPHRVLAVRGPITRDQFLKQGFECPPVYGDPGLLMPTFYSPKAVSKNKLIGFVPHYTDKIVCSKIFGCQEDLNIIDVFSPLETVIDQICSCRVVFSSSLHGIIMAHAYGVPAVWIKFSDDLWGDDTKFFDYFLSVKLTDTPAPVHVQAALSVNELEFIIDQWEQPRTEVLEELTKELMASCPFNGATLGS